MKTGKIIKIDAIIPIIIFLKFNFIPIHQNIKENWEILKVLNYILSKKQTLKMEMLNKKILNPF